MLYRRDIMTEEDIYKRKWIILSVVIIMTFMGCLDSSIVNIALPTMSKNLNVNMGSIEWVVTSYLVVISASILFWGRLGDIIGKTRVFQTGLVIFTIGSLLCGLSTNITLLIISRCIQAIGAAGYMATNQGIITHVFPPNKRGRALGIVGTSVALGTLVGPPLGGFIVSILSWKYIFLINVPIGIITFFLAIKVMPKNKEIKEVKLDIIGTILFAISIISFFFTFTYGDRLGYSNPIIITTLIITIVSIIYFIKLEKKIENPLLDLSIFKNSLFSISIICALISFLTIGSNNIIQPFYLQDVLGLSPNISGLYMMIYPVILAVVAPLSGYLSDKIGSEILTLVGLVLTMAGIGGMATITENTSVTYYIAFVAIMSLGNGLFQSPNNSLVMSTVSKSKLGIAGSVNALVRNVGIVLGVSLATTILYNRMSSKMAFRVENYIQGRDDVFIYGMHYVYIVSFAICTIGAIITAIRLIKKKKSIETELEKG
jgi:EmrB/QacA subfamily drug resistance transporter